MTEIPAGCATYDPDLSALLDGELPEERASEVREHVAGCPRCHGRLASLRAVDEVLVESASRTGVPADLRARLASRIAASEALPGRAPGGRPPARRGSRLLRPAVGLALAAAAALALLVLVPDRELLPPGARPEPATGPRGVERATRSEPIAAGRDAEVRALAALEQEPEDLAVLLELETVEDLDVIANLDLLEELLRLEEGTG